MKTLKKTLSLTLVFAMVFSLMSFAFAADTTATTTTAPAVGAAFTDQASITHTDAVNTIASLGVIKGYPDGSYHPATGVTRGEMCKMICLILNGGKEPVLSTSSAPKFSDINGHWAQKYIEYCANLGIVAGRGDGSFAPNEGVTGSQAAKMLLVAMDYDASVFHFTGANWEVNVNVAANKANLYKELTGLNAGDPLNRDNAAQMIDNALFAGTMELSWQKDAATGAVTQQYAININKTLANLKFGLNVETATLGAATYNATKKEYSYTLADEKWVSGAVAVTIGSNMKSTTDYSVYTGMQVKILFSEVNGKYTVYGVFPYDSSVLLSGVVGVVASDATLQMSGTKIVAMNYKGTTYKFNSVKDTTVVFANNQVAPVAYDTLEKYLNVAKSNPYLLTYSFKMVDVDSDNIIDKVIVYPYTVEKVTYVGATNTSFQVMAIGGATYSVLNTNIKSYDDIKVGDYVKHTAAKYNPTAVDTYEKIAPLANGTVKAKGTLTVTLDTVPTAIGDVTNLGAPTKGLTLGATYENIIQVNGFIYSADLKVDAASAEKFAVITKVSEKEDIYNNRLAKLLFSDGSIKEVAIADITGFNKGDFVSFTVSSGKYTLNNIGMGNYGKYDAYQNPLADTFSYTKGTINNLSIDDGAVVFAKTDDGYKVITGATLKTAHGLSADPEILTKKGSNGFSTILCAYVDLTTQAIGVTKYGYVTATPGYTTDSDKNTVSLVKFWDGTQEVTKAAVADYTDPDNVTNALAKGMFIKYTEDKDGIITITDCINGGKVDFFAPKLAETTGLSANGKTIAFNNGTPEVINSETVIFNIDSENCKGVAGNALTLTSGKNNVVYAHMTDGTTTYVTFIAVDTKNEMKNYTEPTAVSYGSSVDAKTINADLEAGKTVTIEGDWEAKTELTVPAGQTLTVNGNLAPTAALTVNGTVNVTGDYAPAANTAGTGTVTATGAYTPTAANNGATTTATIKAASFTTIAAYTVAEGATLEITGATTNGAFALTVNGTLKTGSIADANVGQLAMGAKSVLNLTGAAATTAVVTKLEAIDTTGAQVTFATATTSVADAKWYSNNGKAATVTGNDGTASTKVGAKSAIAAGTYQYGARAFSDNNQATADVTAWVLK